MVADGNIHFETGEGGREVREGGRGAAGREGGREGEKEGGRARGGGKGGRNGGREGEGRREGRRLATMRLVDLELCA